ncbi:MAG: LamG domain-containing protein [Anaerolineae bacterium]|nr:LamG domain-containing protein [Anaerolineae bacterium]
MAVDDSYTKVLMHFDGENGSTTFIDESGISWTSVGGALNTTSQFKFGTASGYLDGSNDQIYAGDTADLQLGLTFTIDFWFRAASKPGVNYRGIIDKYTGSTAGYAIYFPNSASGAISVLMGASTVINGSVDICDSNWHHVAVVGDGTYAKLYVDGTQDGSTATITGLNLNNSGHNLYIGGDGVSTLVNGNAFYIDELRISKGIARWTSNFTPPTSAYGVISFIPRIIML